jgi:hypothetical protein
MQAAGGSWWQTVVIATLTGTIGGAIATFVRLPTQRKLDQAQAQELESQIGDRLMTRLDRELQRCQEENDRRDEEIENLRSYVELLRRTMVRNNLTVPPMPRRPGVESDGRIRRRREIT